ncbi:MAG: HEPN domain-containing protein [Chloroflexi bacterium]|nr:HEPN domain-containing protein [Chloroflexota bacterium]
MSEEQTLRGYMASAKRTLATARKTLVEGDDFVTVINRSYYAIFYAANGLLQTEKLQSSKHSGVLALFREHFVKTGKIETEFSKIYGKAFDSRMESDYDVEEWPDKALAEQILTGAEKFVARVEQELSSQT